MSADGPRVAASIRCALDWIDAHRIAVMALVLLGFTCVMLTDLQPVGTLDEDEYLRYARALLDGGYSRPRFSGEFAWFGPGLPALLAPLVAIDTPTLLLRWISGPLCLTAATWFLWLAMDCSVGRRAASAAAVGFAALAAFMGANLLTWGVVQSEAATAMFLSLALWMWLRARADLDWRFACGSGAALAAAAMVRVEWGLVITLGLVVSLAVWPLWRKPGAALPVIASATALALCLPWLTYTHDQSGRWLAWGTSGGLSLYWTAVAEPPLQGDGLVPGQVATDPRLAAWRPAMDYGLGRPGRAWRWDSYLRAEALDSIREHPSRFADNSAKNLQRLLTGYPRTFVATPERWYLRGIPGALLLLAAAITAIALTIRRLWSRVSVVPALAVAANLAIHLGSSARPRYLLPLVPLLVWLVVSGQIALSCERRRSRAGGPRSHSPAPAPARTARP